MSHLDWDKLKRKVGHLQWDGGSTTNVLNCSTKRRAYGILSAAIATFATDDTAAALAAANMRPRLVLLLFSTAFSKSIEALTASWLGRVVAAAGFAATAAPKNEEVMVMDDAIGN